MNALKKITTLTLVSIFPLIASAQGPAPFEAYDLNGDGYVSSNELTTFREQQQALRAAEGRLMRGASSAPPFSQMDIDGDGKLTAQELMQAQQMQMQNNRWNSRPGMMQGPRQGRGQLAGRNMPMFSEFDLNGDGDVDDSEFTEARNNRISSRAQQGFPMRGLSSAMEFSDIDRDGNGSISLDEFTAAQALHAQQSN